MTTERITQELEISLNQKRYRLSQPVQPFLASEFPQKLVTGDYTKDSSDIVSTQTWSDWRGGVGVEVMQLGKDEDRSWMSDCDTRFRGHLLLPPLATDTSLTGTPYRLNSFGGFIYAALSTNVKRYDGAWSANLNALANAPRDTLVAKVNGTNWFIIAEGASIYYTTDGTTWYRDTQITPSYLAFWDDQLWAINSGGTFQSTESLSTTPTNNVWRARNTLPTGGTWVQVLFTGPDAGGKEVLYGLTQRGLYLYDDSTGRWTKRLDFPQVAVDFLQLRIAYAQWQEKIYIGSAGLAVYEYSPQNNVVRGIGLRSADGGIPSAYRGRISELVPTFDDLVAVVNGQPYGGQGTVMAWDGIAWRLLYSGAVNDQLYIGHASAEVGSANRIYFGNNSPTGVFYIALPIDRVNPKQVTGYTFQSGNKVHYTPWFDAGWENIDKLALRCTVGTVDVTANETIAVAYALEGSTTFTTLGTINSAGITRTTYRFPNATTPSGTIFRRIQFRLTLVRGGTNTLSPDVTYLSLEYIKRPTASYGWSVSLDLNSSYLGRTPLEQQADIRNAIQNRVLMDFSFRDDTSNDRNYWVLVKSPQGIEQTGHNEKGSWLLQLIAIQERTAAWDAVYWNQFNWN